MTEKTSMTRQFTPFELADQAIGLFLEYRDVHGYTEEDARRAASLEVSDGATVDLAEIGRDMAGEPS